MTDLSIFITVAGLCLSVATFYFGRQSVTKADGKAAGALETDLRYIKESVGRIEGQLNRDVQRLEGRIDEISNQLAGISNTAGRAHESAKSAHNRIDEHLEREHKRARSPSIFCTVYFLDFTQLGIVWPVAYFVAELFTLTVLPSAIEPEAAAVEAPAMSEAFTQP